MEDGRNKILKVLGITGICFGAIVALYILSMYGAIGGSQVVMSKPFATEGFKIQSGPDYIYQYDGMLAQMGVSFVLLTYNLSFIFLFLFIAGVWAYTLLTVMWNEIAWAGSRIKDGGKSFLQSISR